VSSTAGITVGGYSELYIRWYSREYREQYSRQDSVPPNPTYFMPFFRAVSTTDSCFTPYPSTKQAHTFQVSDVPYLFHVLLQSCVYYPRWLAHHNQPTT
jgi:hypothetical protein